MTVAELRAELEKLPDDAEVVVYENSGGDVYDCEGVAPPHEGVLERLLGSLQEGADVVVIYVS